MGLARASYVYGQKLHPFAALNRPSHGKTARNFHVRVDLVTSVECFAVIVIHFMLTDSLPVYSLKLAGSCIATCYSSSQQSGP